MKRKNKEEIKSKTVLLETVQAEVRGGSPEEEVKLRGVGFVKELGFKPGVKDRWSYRCAVVNQKRKK